MRNTRKLLAALVIVITVLMTLVVIPASAATTVAVAGSFNGWSTTQNSTTTVTNNTYTISIYLQKGTYEFKMVYGGNWYGDGKTYTNTCTNVSVTSNGNNMKLVAQNEGTYTFAYTTAKKLTITYEAPSCKHEWEPATCQVAQTCKLCGDKNGEPVAHHYKDGACEYGCGKTTEYITVYVDNTANWSEIYCYTWYGSGVHYVSWPGEKMTKEEDGRWSYQIPTENYSVIFSNGSGTQTADLLVPTTDAVIYDNAAKTWYAPHVHTYDVPATCIKAMSCQCGAVDPNGTPAPHGSDVCTCTLVKLENAKNWSKVYCYFADSNWTVLSAVWPGNEITAGEDGLFYCYLPAGAENLIFNSGSEQTADLKVPTDGNYIYNNSTNAWTAPHVHSWSDATCTEPQKCECGETNGEAAGHNYVDGVCSACGEAAPCEHEFEQNVFYHPELVAATCCTPGVAVYECTKCDYYYTEATDIDPEAHAFWGDREVITAANCATKTNGLVKVSCDNGCGQHKEVEIEYSEAHNWDVQKETYATCTEGGEYYAVCTICSEVESYSVPANGHYNWFVTCGQSGTCMECGAEFTADPHTVTPCEGGMCTNCWETFEPLGHSFVDGSCSACGAEDPNHVPAETKWTFWLSNDSLYAVDGYNIKYNGAGNTYACVGTADVVALAVGNNTFTVTITNNGTAASRVRVDIQGTNTIGNHNVCNVSAVGGDVWTDHDWGGSIVTVPAGESVTLVITYDAEGEFGAVQNLIFFVDAMRGDDAQYSSDITVSDMAFSYVSNEPAHENTLVVGDTNKIVISESNSINNGYGYYVVWVPFVAEEKAHYTFAGENLAIYIYDAAYTFLSDNGTADLEAGNYLICIAYNALATFGEYNVAVTKTEIVETPVEPPHEHSFVDGKCECGESDPNYVPPHEHSFVDGKCECGEKDPSYVPPVEDEPTEKPEEKPADPQPEEPAVELNFFEKIWLAILAFLKKLFGIEF